LIVFFRYVSNGIPDEGLLSGKLKR